MGYYGKNTMQKAIYNDRERKEVLKSIERNWKMYQQAKKAGDINFAKKILSNTKAYIAWYARIGEGDSLLEDKLTEYQRKANDEWHVLERYANIK